VAQEPQPQHHLQRRHRGSSDSAAEAPLALSAATEGTVASNRWGFTRIQRSLC
jgi:hypothetical protein